MQDLIRRADQGDAHAQFRLGVMYGDGERVPEDYAEAVRWFRLAADQGLAQAQSSLGFMYAKGKGVPEDNAEAARWYRLAADQGYANAQNDLGVRYAYGEGVPKDPVYAYMWANLSAAKGDEKGRRLKEIFEEEMTREQIAEAQRLSREWIETHPPDGP